MENKVFLEKLKFGIGDGNLQYYLYNWKCPSMDADKVSDAWQGCKALILNLPQQWFHFSQMDLQHSTLIIFRLCQHSS